MPSLGYIYPFPARESVLRHLIAFGSGYILTQFGEDHLLATISYYRIVESLFSVIQGAKGLRKTDASIRLNQTISSAPI